VAETRVQFGNRKKGDRLPLEVVTRGLVKTSRLGLNACHSELQSVRNTDSTRVTCNYKL
jgi:hypothetical protein